MKKALHIFATLLCLLTLLISTATCMNVVQPKQSSCDHCPKQSPLSQDLPSCCSAQQQPSAIISTEVQQPVQLLAAYISVAPHEIASSLAPPVIRAAAPPPVPPRIALRI